MSCVVGTPVWNTNAELEKHGGALDELTKIAWGAVSKRLTDTVEYHCYAKLAVIKEGGTGAVHEVMYIYLNAPCEGASQSVSVVFSSNGISPQLDATMAVHSKKKGQHVDESCMRESIERALVWQVPRWLDVKIVPPR